MSPKNSNIDNDLWRAVYAAFMDNTPDVAYIKNPEMVFLGASKSMAACLGLKDPAEIIGKSTSELISDEEAVTRYDDNDKSILKGDRNQQDFLEPLPDPEGRERYGLSSKYVVRAADGQPSAVLSISRDVTTWHEALRSAWTNDAESRGARARASASVESVSDTENAKTRMDREKHIINSVRNELAATARVNLTSDVVEFVHTSNDEIFPGSIQNYSKLIRAVIEDAPRPEDALLLQLNLSRESLLDAYSDSRYWTSAEYKNGGSKPGWTEIVVSMAEETATREVYAFIYVSDVTKRRSVEELLPVSVERDEVTHLYTRDTTEKLIDGLMRNITDPERLYSLAIIHMAGLPALRARIGTANAGVETMYLCRLISILLTCDCIVGRYNEDGILVFCPDSLSNEWMTEKIENVIRHTREVHGAEVANSPYRLICGVGTEHARNAGLAMMRSQAIQICNAYRSSETDTVRSFEQYVDSFRISEDVLKEFSLLPVNHEELNRPLLGAEKDAMGECMTTMLNAERYDDSVSGALAVLGKYYDAHRVYTLTLLNDNKSASMQHEWVEAGRLGMMRQMAGVSLRKLPLFKKALSVGKPITIGNWNKGGDKSVWRFISVPILSGSKIIGFLCVENPQKHTTDVALLYMLVPMLMHERARFGVDSGGMKVSGRDELTGLPDVQAFNAAMQSFDADSYYSVGALYASGLNLHSMNHMKGVEYVDEMLVYVANTLADVFKRAKVYRISSHEFAVISTNMSREAFVAQCARVRSIFQRRYQKSFCFGDAWSDEHVSARKLLKDAEAAGHHAQEAPKDEGEAQPRQEDSAEALKADIDAGNFYVCLQPKVDMRGGKTVGAEVLSRRMGSDGSEIMPAVFIPQFERAGVIRELDYFALEQAFKISQGWIDRGIEPLPLSVNFSRQTLLSQSVLASALAIRSRYDVPDDLIEIELAESIGDCDLGVLRQIMDGLAQQGFKFALDDLGSEYSSLKTLGHLTFDTVKLDISLIDSFLYNTMSRSIVESVINACARNGLKCVAEGVKSEEQAQELLEAGCVYAQGYFYGRPIPVDSFYKKYMDRR